MKILIILAIVVIPILVVFPLMVVAKRADERSDAYDKQKKW